MDESGLNEFWNFIFECKHAWTHPKWILHNDTRNVAFGKPCNSIMKKSAAFWNCWKQSDEIMEFTRLFEFPMYHSFAPCTRNGSYVGT